MVNLSGLFTRISFLLKILELALAATCVGLVHNRANALSPGKNEVVYGTYIGYLIVTSIIIVSYLMDTPIHKRILMVTAAVGGVLFVTAGALNLEYYDKIFKDDYVMGAGIVGLIASVVHFADVFFSYRE